MNIPALKSLADYDKWNHRRLAEEEKNWKKLQAALAAFQQKCPHKRTRISCNENDPETNRWIACRRCTKVLKRL